VEFARSPEDYARWVLHTPRPEAGCTANQSYFVCATPRCGSWFLCGLLASTGVAGRPHEWFWRDTRRSLERAWGVRDPDDYVELVLAAGTTPNGIFGAKLMLGSVPDLSAFPEPRFVWLRRHDRVAQAVSFAKAVQTGRWHHWNLPPREEPSYRFDEIDALRRELDDLDQGWRRWFEDRGVAPLEIAYEELVTDSRAAVLSVLELLSLETSAEIAVEPLTRAVADGLGDDWADRYRAETSSKSA
jgi:LPS sulfotransferase NodH